MARAFAAFASGGMLLEPRVVLRVEPAGGGEPVYDGSEPGVCGTPVRPQTAERVMRMLRRVVTDGTGRRVALDEYAVAGKTGTAQLIADDHRGYAPGRYLGSFVGIAPAEDPRLVVLVSLKAPSKNGYYGGTVAGPAVRAITQRTLRYLRVPPRAQVRVAVGETR